MHQTTCDRDVWLSSPVDVDSPLQLPCFAVNDVLQLLLCGADTLNGCFIDNDVTTLSNGTNAKPGAGRKGMTGEGRGGGNGQRASLRAV